MAAGASNAVIEPLAERQLAMALRNWHRTTSAAWTGDMDSEAGGSVFQVLRHTWFRRQGVTARISHVDVVSAPYMVWE